MDEKWFPGHMMKAYRRMKEKINIVDVLIEVIDGRAPLASSNFSLEKMKGGAKKTLLVMNKADLSDPLLTKKWVKYFTSKGREVFPVNSLIKNDVKPLLSCFNKLLNEKKELFLKKGRRDARLRIMVLGIPNVGKSSLINALSKRGRVKVGRKAGVTRGEQWLKIAEGLQLLDTPGVLPFSRKEEVYWKLAVIGAISRERVDPVEILEKFYTDSPSIPMWMEAEGIMDFLEKKGKEYNFFISGGIIDINRTARHFLNELETGKSGKVFTLEEP